MSLFPSISISGTGINVDQSWLDATASNVSNMNDQVSPNQQVYQPQELIVAPVSEVPGSLVSPNTTNYALGQ